MVTKVPNLLNLHLAMEEPPEIYTEIIQGQASIVYCILPFPTVRER